jgi:GTP1/Obg family GTP-binding protein
MEPINLNNVNRFFDWITMINIKEEQDKMLQEAIDINQKLDKINLLTKEENQVRKILDDRENRYGNYSEVSNISQNLKHVMRQHPNWNSLYPFQRESLDMISNKIARIINGDKDYDDSWIDISGYAELVTDRIKK